ncbi:MAG: hypothetical protein AB7N80_10750 [Bdellovibrionales bacterium]
MKTRALSAGNFFVLLFLLFFTSTGLAADRLHFSQFELNGLCEEALRQNQQDNSIYKRIERSLGSFRDLTPIIMKMLMDPAIPAPIKDVILSVLTNENVRVERLEDYPKNKAIKWPPVDGLAFYNQKNILVKITSNEPDVFEDVKLDPGLFLILIPSQGKAPHAQIFYLMHEVAHIFMATLMDMHAHDFLSILPAELYCKSHEGKGVVIDGDFDCYIHELFAYEFEYWLNATSSNVQFGYPSFYPSLEYQNPSFHTWLSNEVQNSLKTKSFNGMSGLKNASIFQLFYNHAVKVRLQQD